jgi:hypothetical protein
VANTPLQEYDMDVQNLVPLVAAIVVAVVYYFIIRKHGRIDPWI